MFYFLEGEIAAQTIPPISTHFCVAWSLCQSSVCHVCASSCL